MFEFIPQKTPLPELLYIADNLAYFPYQVLDESLFIIYHIDLMVSTMGATLLSSFRQVSTVREMSLLVSNIVKKMEFDTKRNSVWC